MVQSKTNPTWMRNRIRIDVKGFENVNEQSIKIPKPIQAK